jgi:superfamily I DNA/RNA helicase
MYLAGDDDQAIFAWAGADVSRFIKEPAKEKVLIYSKRISRTVQEQSMIAIGNISGVKKNKKYYPRDYEGLCEEIYNLDEIDLTKGKWLILARTVSKLLKIEDILREKGLYFESNRGKRIWVSTIHAIKGGEQDNLILCTDLGDKIIKAMNRSNDKADEEHRVWYVAYTRAKNNLYLFKLKNKTRKVYPI